MQIKTCKKVLSLLLAVVLVAAIALTTVGCSDKNTNETVQKTFEFVVVNSNGEETDFTVTTQKSTVGEALLDEGLIAGEDSQYGLYVKTVNGETLDYNTHGMYWSFYIDGAYAMSGADSTEIEEGKIYSFKAEKS